MDQIPPEKMTLEQTMEGLKEWKDGLSATLQRILSSDPSSHLVFRESIETHYKRDLAILSSALSHLEGAQAEKAERDFLFERAAHSDASDLHNSDSCRMKWEECEVKARELLREEIATAMAAQTEGERP